MKRPRKQSKGRLVTLLTDFGLQDEYVGVMKGVILTLAPKVQVVDLSHLVPPQNVSAASHILARAYPFFPSGTVHLTVVDPGVGSDRAILAIAASNQFFVGPDNGVFTPLFVHEASPLVHRVTASHLFLDKVGKTFHGRDIMAPIAAKLACGLPLAEVGPAVPVQDCVQLDNGTVIRVGNILRGKILHVDHFGNLCTNISRQDVEAFAAGHEAVIVIGDRLALPICRSYADQVTGKPLGLFDSHDRLEIAINRGNAAQELEMVVGMPICLALH